MKFNLKIDSTLINYRYIDEFKPNELKYAIGKIYQYFDKIDKSITKQLTSKQIQPIVNAILNSIYNEKINSLNRINRQSIPHIKKSAHNDIDNKSITKQSIKHNCNHTYINYINNKEIIYGIPIKQSDCFICSNT